MRKRIAHEQALWYEDELKKEIEQDRQAHGKKPLKEKDKHVFAYAVETACDQHGWILGYSVHPGNEHDSRTFKSLYEKVMPFNPSMIIADAGYRTPAIARQLLLDGIEPLFPYKCPMTKEGYFRKHEYVYDEYYDCYLCPENQVLSYSTTNRDGYREYKSRGYICCNCPPEI